MHNSIILMIVSTSGLLNHLVSKNCIEILRLPSATDARDIASTDLNVHFLSFKYQHLFNQIPPSHLEAEYISISEQVL